MAIYTPVSVPAGGHFDIPLLAGRVVIAIDWLKRVETTCDLPIGLFGARSLFRMAEGSFWSLNSLAVEPLYLFCREGLRHLVELRLQSRTPEMDGSAIG